MSIIDSIIAEYSQESANTRKVLERIPEEKFGWKPHERSMSFGELASHLADSSDWIGDILETDEFNVDMSSFKPFLAATQAELLDAFDRNTAAAKELMKGQPDEKLMQLWRLKMDGNLIFEMPRVAVLRNMILNHTIHHRGQLTVYLRLNEIPVPAIYGPSADEQG
jgi:uncharacterized damage-inducible protein DinB